MDISLEDYENFDSNYTIEMEDTNRWSLQYNIHITQETADRETEARNEHRKAANSSPQKTQSNFSI